MLQTVLQRAQRSAIRFSNLGAQCWFPYAFHRIRERLGIPWFKSSTYVLTSPAAAHPLVLRPGTSDIHVFRQIFGDNEYNELTNLTPPTGALILDCGANIGCSSAYFLTEFPDISLVAVEPDPSNCEMLRLNLARFAPRASIIQAAVWSEECFLKFTDDSYRDGMQWSRRVQRGPIEEVGSIRAVTISGILNEVDLGEIWLLKVDIERAESIVFAEHFEQWLPRVRNIVIELHDADCERVFFDSIRSKNFRITRAGDLTFCLE